MIKFPLNLTLAAASRPPVFTSNPCHLYRPTTTYQQNQSHHNAADNTTNIPPPLNLASSIHLKFDPWNRLVEVKYSSIIITKNEYDGLGRRIRRDVVPNGNSAAYDDYYNEQWQLLEERKNADTDPLNQYVWHPYYIDALAVCYWDSNTDGDYADANEGAHYYQQDANFNVTSVLGSDGSVLDRYAYSPYGEATCLDATFAEPNDPNISGNTHLYTGRERDPETGLQLNRNRFYHAQMGRWVTRDPIGYEGRTHNLSEYATSNPILSYDPRGLRNCPEGTERDCVRKRVYARPQRPYRRKRGPQTTLAFVPARNRGGRSPQAHQPRVESLRAVRVQLAKPARRSTAPRR